MHISDIDFDAVFNGIALLVIPLIVFLVTLHNRLRSVEEWKTNYSKELEDADSSILDVLRETSKSNKEEHERLDNKIDDLNKMNSDRVRMLHEKMDKYAETLSALRGDLGEVIGYVKAQKKHKE